MKTTAIALDSFAHGKTQYVAGDTGEFSPGEADDLLKAGLVALAGDTAPQTGVTDSQEGIDDLVGGEKMDPAMANKSKK